MQALHDLIANNEEWLMQRVLDYAKEHGYSRYTSTLAEAWRTSIAGLSAPLLEAIASNAPPLPLAVDQKSQDDPLAAFGLLEAKRHRERGVDFALFLGLMKYYRRGYLDLVDQAGFAPPLQLSYRGMLHNYFDRIELSFSREWTWRPETGLIRELQQQNIAMTNEKNKFLTIFESLPSPVLVVNQENMVVNYNHAAAELFFTCTSPGSHYYGGGHLQPLPSPLADEVSSFAASDEQSLRLEKELAGTGCSGHYIIKMQKMLDISGKFQGSVVVLNDISALRKMEEAIEVLNTDLAARASQLELLNQELEAFNYSVSHDLRSPLTNVIGYSQVLLELFGNKLDDQSRTFISSIAEQSLRMNRLIDALLNLSHVSKSELYCQPINLSSIAIGIAENLKIKSPERKLTFTIAPDLIANSDEELLYIVLDNLLGNAWKYTGKTAKARIEFDMLQHNGEKVFFVRDNGVGFDMNDADRLFGTFQRLHDQEEFDGNGIGLATVKRIIKRHDGRIWAEGSVGQGATFYFTLGS